ncbi:folate-binding protein YgfZ [Sphingomonas sp. 28-62-11]|uniref:CAF17-like 4Fe-4S cluster assembly/insertion protein YgfZ n=1 Tax=Sphingomonas sp. 28-62-11 TaxID=1970432 RepID=UPI000BDB74A9|nr:MAG: folate-binding protein YgfZ [Sphingomonas sp. 28-62-11]
MTDPSDGTMLADRALLRLAGEDVAGFLQGLVTQDTTLLGQGPQWTALLSPQGKVLFDFLLWADGEAVIVDAEASAIESLARRLSMYRLRRAITIESVAAAVHWLPHPGQGSPDPRLAGLGYRWLGPPGTPTEAWKAHRLHLGVTEGMDELGNGTTLWLECNARELNGVSFTKGCYVGQENTARMHHRAKVNRRLIVAPIGESSDRTRARYEALGLMVEWRRVDALGNALIPDWLGAALADTSTVED